MNKAAYIQSLNTPAAVKTRAKQKPASKRETEMAVKIAAIEEDRRKLQSENHVLRGELDTLRGGEDATIQAILERVNGLTSAVTFHLNANTMAINALSANIANLNARSDK